MAFDVGQELTRQLAEYEARRGKLAYRLVELARERTEIEDIIKQLDGLYCATELSMAAWNRHLVEFAVEVETSKEIPLNEK